LLAVVAVVVEVFRQHVASHLAQEAEVASIQQLLFQFLEELKSELAPEVQAALQVVREKVETDFKGKPLLSEP
jgi:hypothetical protein